MSSNVIKSNISNIPTIPDYHYQRLPDSAQAVLPFLRYRHDYDRGDFVDEARDFGVSERTAARWLKQFDKLIKKTNHGQYEKL